MKKFSVKMRTGDDVFWGVIFVLLAVLVIISEMGFIEGLGFWTIVFTIVWGATLIKGIVKVDFPQILFSLAFLCIVWDDVLGIQQLTPWPVLGAALLGSIGTSLIFEKRKGAYEQKYYDARHKRNIDGVEVEVDAGEDVKCAVSFGSMVKYVNSDNLESLYVSASFGAAQIYMDKALAPSGQVIVKVDASFSGVQLYLPRDWRVINKMGNAFSGVKEENLSSGAGLVDVILEGKANFSGVTITYI